MESVPRNLRVWGNPWLGTFSPCSRRGRTHGSEYKRSAREAPRGAGARAPELDAWFPPLSRVTCAPFPFPYWSGRLAGPCPLPGGCWLGQKLRTGCAPAWTESPECCTHRGYGVVGKWSGLLFHPFTPRGTRGTLDGTCLCTQLGDALEGNQVGRLAVHLF